MKNVTFFKQERENGAVSIASSSGKGKCICSALHVRAMQAMDTTKGEIMCDMPQPKRCHPVGRRSCGANQGLMLADGRGLRDQGTGAEGRARGNMRERALLQQGPVSTDHAG